MQGSGTVGQFRCRQPRSRRVGVGSRVPVQRAETSARRRSSHGSVSSRLRRTASSEENPRPRRAKNVGGPITEATMASDGSSSASSPSALAHQALDVGVVLVDAAAPGADQVRLSLVQPPPGRAPLVERRQFLGEPRDPRGQVAGALEDRWGRDPQFHQHRVEDRARKVGRVRKVVADGGRSDIGRHGRSRGWTRRPGRGRDRSRAPPRRCGPGPRPWVQLAGPGCRSEASSSTILLTVSGRQMILPAAVADG